MYDQGRTSEAASKNGSIDVSDTLDSTLLFDANDFSRSFGVTHPGRVRKLNQDQFLIAQLTKSMLVTSTSLQLDNRLYGDPQGEVLLVADGMGGHAAGEQASRLAIGHLVGRLLNSMHWFFQDDDDSEKEKVFIENLRELLKDAHARILMESAQNAEQRGMGTTLTMAHIVGSQMYVVHAGDSRCYLIRRGETEQLTTDHTLARQMVESGGLNPEDEADSKWSNVLWNVLGGQADGDLTAEVYRVDLRPGDCIVLCSDGLHRYLKHDAIGPTRPRVGNRRGGVSSVDRCGQRVGWRGQHHRHRFAPGVEGPDIDHLDRRFRHDPADRV